MVKLTLIYMENVYVSFLSFLKYYLQMIFNTLLFYISSMHACNSFLNLIDDLCAVDMKVNISILIGK